MIARPASYVVRGELAGFKVHRGALVPRILFGHWVDMQLAPRSLLPCDCGCRCSINCKPLGRYHREHSCCLLAWHDQRPRGAG